MNQFKQYRVTPQHKYPSHTVSYKQRYYKSFSSAVSGAARVLLEHASLDHRPNLTHCLLEGTNDTGRRKVWTFVARFSWVSPF